MQPPEETQAQSDKSFTHQKLKLNCLDLGGHAGWARTTSLFLALTGNSLKIPGLDTLIPTSQSQTHDPSKPQGAFGDV